MPTLPATLPLQYRSAAIGRPGPAGRHQVIWSTGAAVRRLDLDGELFDEILDMNGVNLARLASGAAPVLDSHRADDLNNVIGVVERAWIAAGAGYAEIKMSERTELAGIRADLAAGILRHVSVGYSIDEIKVEARKGNKIPVLRAIKWTPHELSLTAIGADPGARVIRSAGSGGFPLKVISQAQAADRLRRLEQAVFQQVAAGGRIAA